MDTEDKLIAESRAAEQAAMLAAPPTGGWKCATLGEALRRPESSVGRVSEDPAEALLRKALDVVTGARRKAYGKPEDNFRTIADLWTTYCKRRRLDFTDPEQGFTPGDTAVMMVLMKAARLGESPDHEDSVIDIAGYAACLRRCQVNAP